MSPSSGSGGSVGLPVSGEGCGLGGPEWDLGAEMGTWWGRLRAAAEGLACGQPGRQERLFQQEGVGRVAIYQRVAAGD